MRKTLFSAKIHRATITQADLHYEGSVTIDDTLLQASRILEYEQVHVWNVTRGTRLLTYAIRGQADSGVICINGAAAHGNEPGDLVIIATFAQFTETEWQKHRPRIVRVDSKNRIIGTAPEIPGPDDRGAAL